MSDPSNTTTIGALEPGAVWRFFVQMAAVPRPSKHEEKIRAHVRKTAEALGLEVHEDATGNLLLRAAATPGCENAPTVVLQGHLDMVPEKNADTQHDFEHDPIRLILTTDKQTGEPVVTADGTTLGADNGIGVAMALAAATEPDVTHGPLEILCTVDEEAGMTGAKALAPDFFTGNILINLDSEEDDAIYIGCAGGCDNTLTWTFPLEPCDGKCQAVRVAVRGLRGGHSGGDIHENRGNANKVLVRTLTAAGDGLRLVEIAGGSKRNAIPREAHAVVCGPTGLLERLREAARQVRAHVIEESAEPELAIDVTPADDGGCTPMVSADDTRRLLRALTALPHGVLGMHPKMPDLVQTSNNVATVSTARAADGRSLTVTVGALTRSSSQSLLHVARDQIIAVGELAAAAVESGNEYPGWEPNPDSPTLAVCRDVYRNLFGKEPHVAAIHAGLECGIINERAGGRLDAVSFGPTITGPHSPDEQVYVNSVARMWNYLKAVLAELAKS